MRLSRSRHFKISMGNYEMYEFGCVVTIDHSDLGYSDEEAREVGLDELIEQLTDKCMTVMNDQLAGEIRDASKLTSNDKSFLIESFAPSRSTTRTRKAR